MTTYKVTGGTKLVGTVELHGAKNAGFKEMIASLLADSPSTLTNLGLISEIDFASQIISSLGGKVIQKNSEHSLTIDPSNLSSSEIPSEMSSKSRFSMMYAGPLLARFGKVAFPMPGGDKFAKRPIDRHLEGLVALGAKIEFKNDMFYAKAPKGLVGGKYRFEKNTHNGTEVVLLAAVKAKGETVLENAAKEPEIDDMILYLNNMGAKIKRNGRVITVQGVEHLSGCSHEVMMDRNAAVTFACMALGTKGDILVQGADPKVLKIFLEKLTEVNAAFEIKENGIRFFYKNPLKATDVVAIPHPGFMTDWQPLWATLMTQAHGESIVHEAVYENRFDYVPGLIQMGAKIQFFEPLVDNPESFYNFNLSDDQPGNKHGVKIFGPTNLTGANIEVNDVRSGATTLLAGMIAKGHTEVIDSKDQIKRGYEDLVGKLTNLGANIEVMYN